MRDSMLRSRNLITLLEFDGNLKGTCLHCSAKLENIYVLPSCSRIYMPFPPHSIPPHLRGLSYKFLQLDTS